MIEHQFDFSGLLDELRCHTTGWLHTARVEAIREQRRWRVRELAVTRVLDERGQVDDSLAAKDGIGIRDLRDSAATAKALEDLLYIAAAAAAGALSDDQLTNVAKLADPADPGSDARWAKEAPSWSPRDLAQEARTRSKPTMADAHARRTGRELRWWWRRDTGMLDGRFSLSDVDDAVFESAINEMIERMRPAKGQPWASREHRGADALVELCRAYTTRDVNTPTPGNRPHFIVHVPRQGPATVAGIPLPDAMVEALRAQARIEPVLVGDAGEPVAVGRITSVLSEKTKRVVRQRDGKCRYPGCERREGLHVHHLWPKSWGGSDELWNLAAVCTGASTDHHPPLAPQGPSLLLGNPNHPAGPSLVHRDDLPTLAQHAAFADSRAGHEARAGPTAA